MNENTFAVSICALLVTLLVPGCLINTHEPFAAQGPNAFDDVPTFEGDAGADVSRSPAPPRCPGDPDDPSSVPACSAPCFDGFQKCPRPAAAPLDQVAEAFAHPEQAIGTLQIDGEDRCTATLVASDKLLTTATCARLAGYVDGLQWGGATVQFPEFETEGGTCGGGVYTVATSGHDINDAIGYALLQLRSPANDTRDQAAFGAYVLSSNAYVGRFAMLSSVGGANPPHTASLTLFDASEYVFEVDACPRVALYTIGSPIFDSAGMIVALVDDPTGCSSGRINTLASHTMLDSNACLFDVSTL